jgi:hypothetical protein
MAKRIVCALTMLIALAAMVQAADVTGKWTAQVPARDGGTREQIFNFKSDGGSLTGTMTGFQGNEIPLSDGKIDGNNVSFKAKVEFGGNSIEWTFTGVVSGDEMKLKREGGRGPQEFTAKRVK